MQTVGERVLRVAAYGVVTDGEGRVLLARLSGHTSSPGWWTLPGGGLDHGEHPRDAMVREVLEETGLRATCGELLTVDSLHLPPDQGHVPDDLHAIGIVYRATVEDAAAPLAPEVDGSTDLALWMSPEERANAPLVPLVRAALRAAGL